MLADPATWHLRLFRKSVAKQAKWRAIAAMLGPQSVARGLDLGADNGVISYLLRQRGGAWCSAELDPKAVATIQSVVGDNVYQIDGPTLPFPDTSFDTIVVIDLLEHLSDDATLVAEMHRVLRPRGRLIINVPHPKRASLLRPLRLGLGLTDQWHGHLREGYTLGELRHLLRERFEIRASRTYNRFFSELLDILLNYAYVRKTRFATESGSKGNIVAAGDLRQQEKTFRLYSRLYPLMAAFAKLDLLAAPFCGYSLIISACKCDNSLDSQRTRRLPAVCA